MKIQVIKLIDIYYKTLKFNVINSNVSFTREVLMQRGVYY